MKRITIAICAVLLFSCADEKEKTEKATVAGASTTTPAEPMPDSATMANNWMSYMTPGDIHKMLASFDGNWTGEVSMWMTPDGPPTTSTMTATNRMILGGRYQESVNKGMFNGMPFEGRSTLAYDNAKKVLISTWIDNMGTGIMTMEGTWDPQTKTMSLKGKCVDPMTFKEMDVREVFKVIDDNYQVMEMYGPAHDGKEFKTMEIKYTRKR
jgi:hypothetical protein